MSAADERRTTFLVDPPFQFQYLLIWGLTAVVFITAFVLAFFVLHGWGALGGEVEGMFISSGYVIPFIGGLAAFIILYAALMGVISLGSTHRVAGAAYRLEQCVQQIAQGDYECTVTLRKKDYLQNIAGALNALLAGLRQRRALATQTAERLEALESRLIRGEHLSPADVQALSEIARALRQSTAIAPSADSVKSAPGAPR